MVCEAKMNMVEVRDCGSDDTGVVVFIFFN